MTIRPGNIWEEDMSEQESQNNSGSLSSLSNNNNENNTSNFQNSSSNQEEGEDDQGSSRGGDRYESRYSRGRNDREDRYEARRERGDRYNNDRGDRGGRGRYGRDRNDRMDRDREREMEDEMDMSKYNDQSLTVDAFDIRKKTTHELSELASQISVFGYESMTKQELIVAILKKYDEMGYLIKASGVVEIFQDGFAFLRSSVNNYVPSPDDVYVSASQVRKFSLRNGDVLTGFTRTPRRGEKFFSLMKLLEINSKSIDSVITKISFDDLIPQYPTKQIKLELEESKNLSGQEDFSMRIIELVSPIGCGQRALIVAPPRTGKTVLMQNIARSIETNHPDVQLIVLLIDERPEEVTDMKKYVKSEVVSSTFDESATRHVSLAEIVLAKAKRMVEAGKDVVILLDSITRLARAYNTVAPASGKVLTGGVDANALQGPKRFFGAARNTKNGGSLTIIATALVETGSRMDEVIFEEFKGTGNCEIVLDRKLSDRRIFPAIDVLKSGTRKEDEMVERNTLSKMWMLRRILTQMSPSDAVEFLIKRLKNTKNNVDFFNVMNSAKDIGSEGGEL